MIQKQRFSQEKYRTTYLLFGEKTDDYAEDLFDLSECEGFENVFFLGRSDSGDCSAIELLVISSKDITDDWDIKRSKHEKKGR